jgi:hypothetical protein
MSDLTPVEGHVRAGEVLDPEAALVIRGWPLTVDGLLRNADATRRRYSRAGRQFVAVSAEVTMAGWDLDAILSGPRLRTRGATRLYQSRASSRPASACSPRSALPTTAWSFPRTLRR